MSKKLLLVDLENKHKVDLSVLDESYPPNVMEEISSNVEFYLEELEERYVPPG